MASMYTAADVLDLLDEFGLSDSESNEEGELYSSHRPGVSNRLAALYAWSRCRISPRMWFDRQGSRFLHRMERLGMNDFTTSA